MGRLARVTALVGLLTVWAATEASAQATKFWQNVCGGTTFTTCASVKVVSEVQELSGGGTQAVLVMYVWNRSGDALGGQAGAVITGIALRNLPSNVYSTAAQGADVADMVGPYRDGGSAPLPWRAMNDHFFRDGSGDRYYDLVTVWGSAKLNPIASTCDPGDPKTWMTEECSAAALSQAGTADPTYPGAVRITMNLNRALTQEELDQAYLGIRGRYDNQNSNFEVVPEPITMVLLGTGLAGLGGAGLIRRRRQNGDIENG